MVDVKNPESPHLSLQMLIDLSSVEYALIPFSLAGKVRINLQLLHTPSPCEGKVFANSESHSGDNACSQRPTPQAKYFLLPLLG